jgi:dipeptidyl aminopeptidase/acylaminoacyl peptidase
LKREINMVENKRKIEHKLIKTLADHGNYENSTGWAPDGTFFSPGTYVNAISWAPDGSRLATGSGDARVGIWDFETGELIRFLEREGAGWADSISWVKWCPDGKLVASSTVSTNSKEESLHICDVETGETVARHKGIDEIEWSPDGKLIACVYMDATIKLIDPLSGDLIGELDGHLDSPSCVRWSPDGKTIASCSEEVEARLWDAKTCQQKSKLSGHARSENYLHWFPDSKHLAFCSSKGVIKIMDTKTGDCVKNIELEETSLRTIAVSSDGSFLAAGSHDKSYPEKDDEVLVWECDNFESLPSIPGYVGYFPGVGICFHPSEPILAIRTRDETDNRDVMIWRLTKGFLVPL